jgi:hypothetical protein
MFWSRRVGRVGRVGHMHAPLTMQYFGRTVC